MILPTEVSEVNKILITNSWEYKINKGFASMSWWKINNLWLCFFFLSLKTCPYPIVDREIRTNSIGTLEKKLRVNFKRTKEETRCWKLSEFKTRVEINSTRITELLTFWPGASARVCENPDHETRAGSIESNSVLKI